MPTDNLPDFLKPETTTPTPTPVQSVASTLTLDEEFFGIPKIPDWLAYNPNTPIVNPTSTIPSRSHSTVYDMYEAMFEWVLEKVAAGQQLKEILEEDSRKIDLSTYNHWILSHPQRKQRYYEAQELGAEIVASELIKIADATNSMEDVARSKLRIETRKYLLGIWNRKRFADVKQVEVAGTISVLDALKAAEDRMKVIEHD